MHSNQAALIVYQEGLPNHLPLAQMDPSYYSATLSPYPLNGVLQPVNQGGQPVSSVIYVGRHQGNHGRGIFNGNNVNQHETRRHGRYLSPSEIYPSNTFPRVSETRGYEVFPVATYSGLPAPKSGYGFTLPTVNQNRPVLTQGQLNQTSRRIVFPHINVNREHSPAVAGGKGAVQIKSGSNHVQATTVKDKKQVPKLPPGCTGLLNLGNTCYMNSVLQCLSHTRVLVEYCYEQKQKNKRTKGNLANALADVFKQMWSGAKIIDPTEFRKKMLATITGFDDDACQEDAQEFLLFLLGSLHNFLKKKRDSKHQSVRLFPQCDEVADSAWKKFLSAENGAVVDIFMAQQRSSLTCSSCDQVSHTFEPAQGLSLPIPKTQNGTKVSLLDCLRHYFHKETLGGDEKPACSNCNNRSDSTKRLSLQKFPKIFVIQLNRFSNNSEGMTKITTPVHYPVHNLNFKEFAYVNANVIYNLYAVVEHVGKLDNGHYMATVKNKFNNAWYHYDDEIVFQVPENHAVTQSAYILFYELHSAEAEKPDLNLKNLFIDRS